MKRLEYGEEHSDVIVLLHGGGLSWWSYRDEAEILSKDFRVVIPILDGHAGSERRFMSIADCASEVINLIDKEFNGHVYAMGGLSLGAQILLNILSLRPSICDKAIVESASVIPSRLTNALISPMLSLSYPLIRLKWFSRLQFKALRMNKSFYKAYYEDSIRIGKEDMASFLKASTAFCIPSGLERCKAAVAVIVGGREQRKMIQSASLIHKAIPSSILLKKDGLYHGEFSINHPESYVKELLARS